MATPSLVMIPSGYKSEKVYSVIPSNGDGDFTFTREGASGQPNSTRVNKDGLIEEVNSNVPRLDYSDGSCPSLLLEPQSTNLFPYSEDFSVSDWYKGRVTINSNQNISPDDTLNASKMIETTGNGNHQITKKAHSVNGSFTNSVFAKKGENNYLILGIWDGSSETLAWFDLENGLISTVQGTSTQTIEKFGDYYRCSVTFNISGSGGYELIGMSNADGLRNYTGDGTSGVYIWGAQAEQLSYPTSYIPTNGAIATRLADVCTGSGNASLINSTEGTLFVELAALANDYAVDKRLSISDGTTNNRVLINIGNGISNIYTYYYSVSGSNQINRNISVTDITQNHKLAVTWKTNEFKIYLDGSLNHTDTSGSVNPAGTFTQIQFADGDGTSTPFHGKVKEVRVYKEALTEQELTDLTS